MIERPLPARRVTEAMSYSSPLENRHASVRGCQCPKHTFYTELTKCKYIFVVCRSFDCHRSSAANQMILLLVLASLCLAPCSGVGPCSSHNIQKVKCLHGTCLETIADNMTQITAFCMCQQHWSGAACDIYHCGGRTL